MKRSEYAGLTRLAESILSDPNQGKGRGLISLGILRARDYLAGLQCKGIHLEEDVTFEEAFETVVGRRGGRRSYERRRSS